MQRLLFLLTIAFVCSYCQEPCRAPIDSVVVIRFLNYQNKNVFGDSVKFINIKGIGAGKLLLDSARATATFYLPLSPEKDTIRYEFIYKNKQNVQKSYTFSLYYKRTAEIRHPSCGVSLLYSALQAKNANFDSTSVVKTIIDDDFTKPNIVFYFKP